MAKFTCIEQFAIDDIKSRIDSGEFDVNKLREITNWKDRMIYLKSNFHEDIAEFLNKKFENTLFLKDKEKGFEKFADTVTFKNAAERAEFKAKMLENIKAKSLLKEQLQEQGLLKDAQTVEDELFQDIASRKIKNKYQTEVTQQEIEDLTKLNQVVKEKESLVTDLSDKAYGENPELRDAYGQAINDFNAYMKNIITKEENLGFKEAALNRAKKTVDYVKGGKTLGQQILRGAEATFKTVTSPVMKAVKASFDFLPIGRQIQKLVAYDKKIGGNAIREGFNVFFGKSKDQLYQKFKNFVASDEYYNLLGKPAKLHLELEEAFVDPLIQKTKVFGGTFTRSNDAFSIAMQGSRLKIFKKMVNELLEKNGLTGKSLEEIAMLAKKDPEGLGKSLKDIAYVSNSISGRGGLGKALNKNASFINNIMFAPRYVVSSLDSFIKPFDPMLDPIARKAYQKTSARQLAVWTAVLGTASMIDPKSVDMRPNSTNFGKVQIDGKWMDVSGGIIPYAIFVARMFSDKYVTAGTAKEFETAGFNKSKLDMATDFWGNKLAPTPSIVLDFLKGTRRDYKKDATMLNNGMYGLKQLFLPISISQFGETAIQNWDKDMEDFAKTMTLELGEFAGFGGYRPAKY